MYRVVPRTEYGLPEQVTNSNGSLRPPLRAATFMTAHYTGNNISYVGKDVAASIRMIQQVFAKTKPFEYNYVIGLPEDDLIYEYAGTFQAAHSAGENHAAVGVLFLVGINDTVTPTMINKWRWLRDRLAGHGIIVYTVDQRMHYQMPGAATACPGVSIKSQWPQFLLPYQPPVPPPTTIEDDMIIQFYTDTRLNGTFACAGGRWVPWLGGPLTPSVPHFVGDHPWTREQVLSDQGQAAATLWRARMG